MYTRLSEPRLSESSHIRTAKRRIIIIFISFFNDIHIVIELSVTYFSMDFTYLNFSDIRTNIFFCVHKGVRISEDVSVYRFHKPRASPLFLGIYISAKPRGTWLKFRQKRRKRSFFQQQYCIFLVMLDHTH